MKYYVMVLRMNVMLEFKREKFYPGPGLEPGPLAFRANALTNWAIKDKFRTTIELISQAIFSVLRTDTLRLYYVL